MKKILILVFLIFISKSYSQTEIIKTVTVDDTGWKRVARLDGGSGRGYNEIVLMTTGGTSNPRVSKISWFKGWSNYGGLNLVSVGDNGYWSDARITSDGVKAYLEVNFTNDIPLLRVYLDQSAWTGGDILDGTLPNGGNTVIVSAKFGRVNFGENDFFLDYNGNIGIGTTDPSATLQIEKPKPVGFISYLKNTDTGISSNGLKVEVSNSNVNNTVQRWMVNNIEVMRVRADGNVGIGTTTPDAKLAVKGNIHTNEVKVDLLGAVAPDYVFCEDYHLKTLTELENYITKEGHLPNIPSAKEMETNGLLLKEMNLKLLEKIEELTLYTIQQEKEIKSLKKVIYKVYEREKDLHNQKSINKNLEDRLQKIETLLESKK